jgi:hypothetical protein
MDKRPSDQWKDYLHEKRSLDKASEEAYKLYIDKYSKTDDRNHPRKEKMDDKFFVPGKIYSFLYVTSENPSAKRPVINRRPVLLSLGQMVSQANKKIYEIGIDFVLVPPKVRVFILDQLYKIYKKDINENQKNLDEGRKGKKPLKFDYDTAKKIFDKLGWQMAFSAYEKGNVARPAVYDYEDWVSVIPLYTRGVTGKPLKDIFNEYIKRMTTPPEVDLNEKLKTAADRKRDDVQKSQKKFKDNSR